MLIVKRKFFKEIWFSTKKNFNIYPTIYKQFLGRENIKFDEEFITLLIDLSKDNEEIFEKYDKDTKYEIRRAKKEGIIFEEFKDKDYFLKTYNKMSKNLKINKITKNRLDSFGENLIITRALFNNYDIIYHVYIFDEERVRLLYSVRNITDEVQSKIYGFANRFLHDEDIKFFKSMNKKIYDFGGIGNGKSQKTDNIDKFKYSFGGEVSTEKNSTNFLMRVLFVIRKGYNGKIFDSFR